MMKSSLLLILIALLLPAFSAIHAQDSLNVSSVSQIDYWDSVQRIALSGDYAYVASRHSGLRILDVSDLSNIVEVGFFFGEDEIRDVIVEGNYAYLRDYSGTDGWFRIVDISDPENPFETANIFIDEMVCDIKKQGDYVYFASHAGLHVFDVTDAYNPFQCGMFNAQFGLHSVAVSGDIACAGAISVGFQVFNISNPAVPSILSTSTAITFPFGIDIVDNLAYCVSQGWDLWIMDISNPSFPQLIGNNDQVSARFVEVIGDAAYIAGDYGFELVDVSNPQVPILRNSLETPYGAWGLAVDGNTVFLAAEYGGLMALDVSVPHNIEIISTFGPIGNIGATAYSEGFVYASDHPFGLIVYDVADPGNPVEYSGFRLDDSICDLVIQDNYAYLATGRGWFIILDISDPANIEEIERMRFRENVFRIAVEGDYAYLACRFDAIAIIDISDPANPEFCSAIQNDFNIFNIDAGQGYLYITAYTVCFSDVYIYDVSDPMQSSLCGILETSTDLMDVEVRDNYAYIANMLGGAMRVADISDPGNPIIVAEIDENAANKIILEGDYAYLSGGYSHDLNVVDISDPLNPVIAGYYDPENYITVSSADENGYLYCGHGVSFNIFHNDLITADSEIKPVTNDPVNFQLLSLHPNPSNGQFVFEYQIAQAGEIRLEVFDILGRSAGLLKQGYANSGNYQCRWNTDGMASGTYFVSLSQGAVKQTYKAVLVK